ncbi:SDR family oxidoreductase [Rhizobium ruizarguesonis]|uniref:SDR family oxidoreductase n=2 Tax=Rhizobium TaxID=379 RepID=A0A179BC86_RHILE|nr:SDR family oxidoreductase [Rhizobium leguminosarum]OAP88761.1 hypothetical protein A4U53_08330 [Rhizobium leguminosarum]
MITKSLARRKTHPRQQHRPRRHSHAGHHQRVANLGNYADLMKLIPYKRIGATEEIGRRAVRLAPDFTDYIVGATTYIDGGMTLYPGFEPVPNVPSRGAVPCRPRLARQ